ncbi:MAG TPA: hypothetical protein DEP53_06870 [Bacteroidetes bacterium]|nr:hypothetical protein [Bacteroidota bacterium]
MWYSSLLPLMPALPLYSGKALGTLFGGFIPENRMSIPKYFPPAHQWRIILQLVSITRGVFMSTVHRP